LAAVSPVFPKPVFSRSEKSATYRRIHFVRLTEEAMHGDQWE
jgi:hypothetical protein